MKSRRLIAALDASGQTIVSAQMRLVKGPSDVRFGSQADICNAISDVRFTPESDRESEFSQKGMSALPPKADMCSAAVHVRFGPIADIEPVARITLVLR